MSHASDLPESFTSASAMARALSSYMTCPYAVRRAVLDSFMSAPDVPTIRTMRARHLAPKSEPIRHKVEGGYYPAQVSRALDETNRRFLQRLAAAYPERFAA